MISWKKSLKAILYLIVSLTGVDNKRAKAIVKVGMEMINEGVVKLLLYKERKETIRFCQKLYKEKQDANLKNVIDYLKNK